MKGLWVDDVRDLPSDYVGWDVARSYQEAIDLLSARNYDVVSLDHDLASYEDGQERTGYDIVKWIVQRKFDGFPVPRTYRVHSANPVGRDSMKQMIDRYLKEYTSKDAAAYKVLAELGLNPHDLTPDEQEHFDFALAERSFNDMFQVKNRWLELMKKGELNELKQNLYVLIHNAYGPIGGHVRVSNPDKVLDPELTYWEAVDVDVDPEADMVMFGRQTPFGVKVSGWGHDGSRNTKSQLMDKVVQQLNKPGYYIEASSKPAEILLSKGAPVVDQAGVEKVFGQKVEWLGDGFYNREINGQPMKNILFGRPTGI